MKFTEDTPLLVTANFSTFSLIRDSFCLTGMIPQKDLRIHFYIRSELAAENGDGRDALIYYIDTLLRLIKTADRQKAYDFADTVHNLPEICTGSRIITSFTYEVDNFRTLYGNEYFPEKLFF